MKHIKVEIWLTTSNLPGCHTICVTFVNVRTVGTILVTKNIFLSARQILSHFCHNFCHTIILGHFFCLCTLAYTVLFCLQSCPIDTCLDRSAYVTRASTIPVHGFFVLENSNRDNAPQTRWGHLELSRCVRNSHTSGPRWGTKSLFRALFT
jgi:hypothetical protein